MSTIIVACDPNFLIGTSENTIPWNIPEDMKFFKETTLGHPIIMGRKTWESLPKKPLPRRLNIVISRTLPKTSDDDTFGSNDKPMFFESIQEACDGLKIFKHIGEPFIIGGAQIYRTALDENLVDKIIMTQVRKAYQGTIYFPSPMHYGFKENQVLKVHEEFQIVEYVK